MSDQLQSTPDWAIPLLNSVSRIEEKLDNLKDWSERNILDHEGRLRGTENTLAKMSDVIDRLAGLEERQARVEKRIWMAMGALSLVVTVAGFFAFNINLN
jgi:hypothetical protein